VSHPSRESPNGHADISYKGGKLVTLRRAVCWFLSAVAVLGCAVQERRSLPTDTHAASRVVTMPLYDETAYYNAVKNRWFGLGDYATDQPGR
jgi:outer membrane protein